MPEQMTEERLIDVLQYISRERNIPFEMLIEALEAALLTAYKRHFGSEANAIVSVDRQTGEYKVFHRRIVAEEITDPKLEVTPEKAGEHYQPGDYFDEEVTPKDFGRIAAQTAKQVIVQRIREAERDTVYNKYAAKLNDIVTGTVQRFEQRNMYVLLDGKDEAMLPLSEQVPRENFRINDFIRAYVLDVRKSPKGPSVILSRSTEGLVQRLLEFNVPEVEDGTVEIMAIAREPGSRTKVAVRSNRDEVDPIGACLGPKSSRIANVSDELRGEKIDVIKWDPDQTNLIMNALAPAKVLTVELFEDDGVALVDGAGLSAFASDRKRRPERAPGGADDRLASGHYERDRSSGSARTLLGRTRRAASRTGGGGSRRGRGRRGRSGDRRRSHPQTRGVQARATDDE